MKQKSVLKKFKKRDVDFFQVGFGKNDKVEIEYNIV